MGVEACRGAKRHCSESSSSPEDHHNQGSTNCILARVGGGVCGCVRTHQAVPHATFTGDTHNKSPCVLQYPYTGMAQELLLIPILQVKFLTFRDFCDLFKTAQLVTWRPITQNLASPLDDNGIMSMGRGLLCDKSLCWWRWQRGVLVKLLQPPSTTLAGGVLGLFQILHYLLSLLPFS